MNHLTDERLSALLDDVLPAGERAAAEAHLAGCDACRARLAELSSLDESLGRALTHDPGDAYFADFAERVEKRIAAEEKPASSQPSFWGWFTSPRGLTFAGSTAALVLTAGLAWMRFHNENDVTRALRASAPSPVGERARQHAFTADGAAPPPVERSPSPPAASLPAPAMPPGAGFRAQRIPENSPQASSGATQDRLDEREVAGSAAPVPAAAPATGSTLAQMKRRSIVPAEKQEASSEALSKDQAPAATDEASAKTASPTRAEPTPAAQNLAPPPAPQPAPQNVAPSAAPQAFAPTKPADSARGQLMPQWGASKSLAVGGHTNEVKLDMAKLAALSPCGRVRDSRGRSIAGAEITAVHGGVRTTRSAPDGSFCLGSLKTGDTLTVMHVGFDPYTAVVDPTTSLAIELQPVGTLGPQSTMLMGKSAPQSSFSSALEAHEKKASDSARKAPAADMYEGQSRGVQALVDEARAASAIAQRDRTVESHESAAKAWADVALQVHGAPAFDSRFRYLTALREAYHLAPTDERGARLRSGLAAFVATAPASLPERATVQRWQAELNAPTNR